MTALTTSPFFTVPPAEPCDGSHDHIPDVAELTAGAAQHADGLDFLGAGVIGDFR